MIKISKPFRSATYSSITQGFKPKEHEANDFAGKYGEFLVAPFNAKVINVVGIENDPRDFPDGSLEFGYGIRLQSVEDPTITSSYWHCQSTFPYKKGDYVTQGTVVAMMGNSGFVMAGGEIVETDMKLKFPYKGTHVHWSMGQQVGKDYTALDPSQLIEWSKPINYSLLDTINLFLMSIEGAITKVVNRTTNLNIQ